MISSWTNEEIEAIMVQLNNQNLPFNKYEFSLLGEGMRLLGSGAFANVYEALDKGKHVKEAAIKVIGFGNRHVDSESFRSAVEAQKDLGYSVDSVVKIYDSIELRVWIKGNHDVEKVEKVELHEQAKKRGITNTTATCTLMMELGEPVYFYEGSEKNIKLTTLDDMDIFKALLMAKRADWLKE